MFAIQLDHRRANRGSGSGGSSRILIIQTTTTRIRICTSSTGIIILIHCAITTTNATIMLVTFFKLTSIWSSC